MNEYKSALHFKKYIVNEVYLKNNEKFIQSGNTGTPIKFSIQPEITTDNKELTVKLTTDIFKDAEESNYPFEMKVVMTGYFMVEGEGIEKFISNAIAILYPYIRSIVSTYTSNANVAPLILPVINVNKMIEEQSKNEN